MHVCTVHVLLFVHAYLNEIGTVLQNRSLRTAIGSMILYFKEKTKRSMKRNVV